MKMQMNFVRDMVRAAPTSNVKQTERKSMIDSKQENRLESKLAKNSAKAMKREQRKGIRK